MAFRIRDNVVRGEIDNRVKGIVRGRIWLAGCDEPLRLELKGNACPDLAGCLLTFSNPKPHLLERLDALNVLQRGGIGDLTASRKVRVFDVPLREALARIRRKEKPPEHMANCLYLEWFSEANGRVVIESSDYHLTISPPEWRLTPEEERERARQAAAGMADFLGQLTDAIEQHQRGLKHADEEWNEHDYEKFLREREASTDKYRELLDKYGDSDAGQDRIAKEMGWLREDQTEEEREVERQRIKELNAICDAAANEPAPDPDPTREGIDWIRTEDGELSHPLAHRCAESAIKFWRAAELPLNRSESDDLDLFVFEFQTTAAKLAGALNGLARGEGFSDDALTVAWLKRALNHLHRSQGGLETVAPRKLLPDAIVTEARQELFEIREEILRLMNEFRGRA